MIVVDNCIISSLSKVGRLEILRNFSQVFTSQGVVEEILRSEIPSLIQSVSRALKGWLEVRALETNLNNSYVLGHQPALSYVDCELVLLCLEYDAVLLTDDTKLIIVAENEFGIRTFDLCETILALKRRRILSPEDVLKIIEDLEKKDRYSFSTGKIALLTE